MTPTTVAEALRAALSGDPARPLITYLGPGDERTELSVRTFENNVAKTANLLRDEAGVTPASRVALLLPVHWQTAVWIGACALTGSVAWLDGDPGDPEVEVSVTGPARLDAPRAPLALATSLHPFGLPFTGPLPRGLLDAAVEVRAQGDRFTPYDDVPGDAGWIAWDDRAWTQTSALSDAADLAASAGLTAGGRALCDVTRADGRAAVLAMLALPLAVGGSVVLLADAGADADAIAARERCGAVLR